MKKNLLLFLMIFSALNLFSQIEKGNISIGIDGNYTKVNTPNGVTTNLNYTKGNYLNAGATIGYFITERFIAGAGLDYILNKETRYNSLYFNNFLQNEEMDIKSKVFLPNVFLGYYYQVANKLYFSTTLKFSYGKVKTSYSTTYAGTGPFADSTWTIPKNNVPYVKGSSGVSETDYFSTQIYPEVLYFISAKFGICLNLGGIAYSINDWETNNSSFAVNFKPDYWRFGIKFRL
jgi:hypothetical protein